MNISKFEISTFPLEIALRGRISSEELNAFSKAASTDLGNLSSLLNDYIIKILGSLPQTFEPGKDYLDGAGIYLDSQATQTKDNGIFYFTHPNDESQNRPITVYEGFLLFLQILANMQNGLREGEKFGSYSDKVTISNGQTVSRSWPYSDGMFELMLFEESGGKIIPMSLTGMDISVNPSNKTLNIINSTGSNKVFWGYVWHPVLTF